MNWIRCPRCKGVGYVRAYLETILSLGFTLIADPDRETKVCPRCEGLKIVPCNNH